MTSDGRGKGGSAKSDFISKGSLIKHLMRGGGGVKKWQKSSDVIYGRPLIKDTKCTYKRSTVKFYAMICVIGNFGLKRK